MIIKNIFSIVPAYTSLYKDVRKQKRFVNAIIKPEISRAREQNDDTLDENDFKKIRQYYGFGVPAIVGESFCTLRGMPMTEKERIANTYQGALTGLYDDFFDKTKLDPSEIRKMMDDPYGFQASSSLEKLFIHFLKAVHQNLHDKEFFMQTFDQVFDAQIESKQQSDTGISIEEIKEITFRKGGHSLLFYRSVFSNKVIEGEMDALYNAGSLMQLGNDIFDVYDDSRDNIRTLLTACENIKEVRQIFTEQMEKTIILINTLKYKRHQLRKYTREFILGISRCFVCLDQLEALESKSGGKFKPAEYSREELICDMEKPSNMLASLKYYLNYKF